MYLKKLHIKNFRCFSDYEIEFAPRVTVLFGKNGSGKSTLIHAMHKAMSMMMHTDAEYKTEKVKVKNKTRNVRKAVDYRTITEANPYLHVESFAKDDFNTKSEKFIIIEAWNDLQYHSGRSMNESDMHWKMLAATNTATRRPSEYIAAFNAFYNWHLSTNQLPLLAYFSDAFPHLEDNKKQTVVNKIASLRNFGYFDWNEEAGCTNEWLVRLENKHKQQAQLLLKNIDESTLKAEIKPEDKAEFEDLQKETQAIENVFKTFSKYLDTNNDKSIVVDHIGFDKATGKRLSVFTPSGESYEFRKLPAGYKRLYSIVLDLAYRSFILSEGKSTDIDGLIIVDEIDLHLHPELEGKVLGAFMKTFTKVQFVVSTHSQLVLTGLETENQPNCILRLSAGTNRPELWHDVFGLDSNTGLTEIMGVDARNEELNWMIGECAFMRFKKLNEQADALKHEVLAKYPVNADRIESLIAEKLKEMQL